MHAHIDVDFEHWRVDLPEEKLSRYNSPHFDEAEVARYFIKFAEEHAHQCHSYTQTFSPDQLLCANEAFPEAAVADPLGDLEVWDEWRSGTRVFPYEGKFGRLGIRAQDPKTQSPSSVGVIGEIMAGIYAQAGIAPQVLVRVIRRWPDFIFYTGGDLYAFVEAKAFTQITNSGFCGVGLRGRVRDKLLGDCLRDAVRQLNADTRVVVWGAFTQICSVTPMRFAVTFLEVRPAEYVRRPARLPAAVEEGLAFRALLRAAYRVEPRRMYDLQLTSGLKSSLRQETKDYLIQLAMEEVEGLLAESLMDVAQGISRESFFETLQSLVRTSYVPEEGEGKRFFEAKQRAIGEAATLRHVGGRPLIVINLGPEDRSQIDRTFRRDWKQASRPWIPTGTRTYRNREPLWRCGGSVFGILSAEEAEP